MKSKILQASVGLAVALPLATAGAFSFANSAEAAALTGQFQISPGISLGGYSSAILTQNSLTFTPDPLAPINTKTPIGITPQSGSFQSLGFNSALIGDIIQFTPVLNASNPLLDLGSLSPLPGVILPGTDTTSVTDGQNVFVLESASYSLSQGSNDANVTVAVALNGFFRDVVGGTESKGAGNLTFQIAGSEIAQLRSSLGLGNGPSDIGVVTSALSNGKSFTTSFSGALFTTTVPEPATLLGLGLTGAAMFVSRRRKGQVVS